MINIKPFKQTDDSRCGPACVKMILDYYDIKDRYYCEVSEDEACRACDHAYELGCTNSKIKEALESYGLTCHEVINSSIDIMKPWVKSGKPIIVDWFSPGDPNDTSEGMPNGHSSIVVDVDDEYITLMDPEIGGLRKIKREEFMRVWFDWEKGEYLDRGEDLILRYMLIVIK